MRISDWSSDVCSSDLLGDFDSRIKRAPRSAQVAREHCDGKIGPAAHFVYFVDWLIGRFEYIAGLRDQIPSRREADDTDLVGVDLERTGARANQAYRTLAVLQRKEVLGRHCTMAALIIMVVAFGNAVFVEHANSSS